MDSLTGIFILVCIILAFFAITSEYSDRQKIIDRPSCNYFTNYCTEYGGVNGIKYLVREATDEKETVSMLLDKIRINSCKNSYIVYWRMSLIIALITCFVFHVFLRGMRISIHTNAYIFLFLFLWFFNYWSRNYFDFHYYSHSCMRVEESIEQIKKYI